MQYTAPARKQLMFWWVSIIKFTVCVCPGVVSALKDKGQGDVRVLLGGLGEEGLCDEVVFEGQRELTHAVATSACGEFQEKRAGVAKALRQRGSGARNKNLKEEIELLCPVDVVYDIENLVNYHVCLARYEINLQKSGESLYTSKNQLEM